MKIYIVVLEDDLIKDLLISLFCWAIFGLFMHEKNSYGFFVAPFVLFFTIRCMYKWFKIGVKNRYNYYRSIGDYYTIKKMDEVGISAFIDKDK